ncbi:hypothetical protein ACJ41P_26505 [Azospirillum argentinense]|uniref:Uncharacterized protein n=1 Tax=Azospirillum argentinense TaxID=2970906 RepID=A0ABW8VE24_9PROT
MKKFAIHRPLRELKPLCEARGIQLDTTRHDRDFSDFVTLSGVFGNQNVQLLYSVFNGTFFGETASGERFSETSSLDGEPWFDALLDLLYVPMEASHG